MYKKILKIAKAIKFIHFNYPDSIFLCKFVVMMIDEKKLFRYMDIGFYVIFIPIFLLLIPTDHIVNKDIYFFIILMVFVAVIRFVNRRHNPISYVISGEYAKSLLVVGVTLSISIMLTRVEALDMRHYNILSHNPVRTTEMKIRSIWMLYFVEFSFTIMTALILELLKETKYRQNIEEEKNRAEVQLYKSQINPHFMLNTLNTLYGLYITHSSKTGEVFLKFSDMIKYTFSNSDKDRVMVCEEIKYLREYIDLHTLRLSEHTSVNFSCEVDDESLLIPPMILITFIENAFKYGVSSSQSSDINIRLHLKNRRFLFETENTIFSRLHSSTGVGLNNCKKRLELLYPDGYTLEYGERVGDNKFHTILKIRL